MLTLKQKVKCHFMKQGEYISEGDKDQNTSLFSFSIKQIAFFLFPEWVQKKVLWKNCKDNLEKGCRSWKKNKRDRESSKILQTFCLCNLGR